MTRYEHSKPVICGCMN